MNDDPRESRCKHCGNLVRNFHDSWDMYPPCHKRLLDAVQQSRSAAIVLRSALVAVSQEAFVDGLLLQPLLDEHNNLPTWLQIKVGDPSHPRVGNASPTE